MTLPTLRTTLKAAVVALMMTTAAATMCAQNPSTPTPRPPVWETVSVADAATSVPGEVEVAVRDGGTVVIKSDHEVKVQVFSILGQLITEKLMQPGVVRLRMNTRGIYILKADNSTRRISL